MKPNIEFSKTRDLGEIIGDTFVFIRENFLPLIKCFFIFCGFFMLATAIASVLQQTKMLGFLNNINSPALNPDSFSNDTRPLSFLSKFFGVEYVLVIIFALLNITAITTTVLSYIAVYKAKGNIAPIPEEVWAYVKYYFFRIMGALVLTMIITLAGAIFCILPGIYLGTVLSLSFAIIIVENTSIRYALNRSFQLIKDNWWATFGSFFIMGIIVYTMALIVMVPAMLIGMGSMFLHPGNIPHMSTTLVIVTAVVSTVCHIFYILPLITIGLCYFNLTELKDATGLMERINHLGDNLDAPTDLPAEEY